LVVARWVVLVLLLGFFAAFTKLRVRREHSEQKPVGVAAPPSQTPGA
jgi:hypothetical protein